MLVDISGEKLKQWKKQKIGLEKSSPFVHFKSYIVWYFVVPVFLFPNVHVLGKRIPMECVSHLDFFLHNAVREQQLVTLYISI